MINMTKSVIMQYQSSRFSISIKLSTFKTRGILVIASKEYISVISLKHFIMQCSFSLQVCVQDFPPPSLQNVAPFPSIIHQSFQVLIKHESWLLHKQETTKRIGMVLHWSIQNMLSKLGFELEESWNLSHACCRDDQVSSRDRFPYPQIMQLYVRT